MSKTISASWEKSPAFDVRIAVLLHPVSLLKYVIARIYEPVVIAPRSVEPRMNTVVAHTRLLIYQACKTASHPEGKPSLEGSHKIRT